MRRSWHQELLTEDQAARIEEWLTDPQLVADLSWGLTDTKVLQLRSSGRQYILKTAGPRNHHMQREFAAHARFTRPLVERGITAHARFADEPLRLLVMDYLPGYLCDHSPAALDPEIHVQAGHALRLFHEQSSYNDENYEEIFIRKCRSWLADDHRIDQRLAARASTALREYRTGPALLVPTHGDWQPRNWIINGDSLHVIDFGRFDFRPASSDLNRLAVQQFKDAPELESAFLEGYGDDPRDSRTWPVISLREAIGTAVWAYQVGDTDFEAQGHQMLSDALDLF
ncbi:phosphotransferase [Glutamicibacter sp.]|jgi:Mn2+-dependent serine/threonine protein kinase|uniref:phosphotransferase n=1 Tax=Glutamicibacter sp. TaxID=1931995 RepID=UPI002B4677FD|nr:phosphotransferase [Glutamicibacter sp.]HJX78158.1 phosphotransferase [Glutamicibacter sp.]